MNIDGIGSAVPESQGVSGRRALVSMGADEKEILVFTPELQQIAPHA